ncbi:hypothetical protein ES703_78268 [subsurface metagenome]
MKIKLINPTDRPEPRFVIESETDEDALLLKVFSRMPYHSKEKLHLIIFSETNSDEKNSFEFGWDVEENK